VISLLSEVPPGHALNPRRRLVNQQLYDEVSLRILSPCQTEHLLQLLWRYLAVRRQPQHQLQLINSGILVRQAQHQLHAFERRQCVCCKHTDLLSGRPANYCSPVSVFGFLGGFSAFSCGALVSATGAAALLADGLMGL
jgi:hypothetical protein